MTPPGQQDGPQQKRLHALREDGIAAVDGELTILELVGEAYLPQVGMALLGVEQVRRPDSRVVRPITSAATPAPRLLRTTWITTYAF